MSIITKYFFICNIKEEEHRYLSIKNQINNYNINNYEIFNHIWGNELCTEYIKTLTKTDYSMIHWQRNMIDQPLSKGEISLFLNHIECLKKIRSEYKEGIFCIFESDVILYDNFTQNIDNVLSFMNNIDWDLLNIGEGTDTNNPNHNPIIVRSNSQYTRCAEGLVWNYKFIIKFLEDFEKNMDINGPIDSYLQVYINDNPHLNIYSVFPYLVYQGSRHNIFKSLLR
jgi:GR25 family glycosyltransferase involved in LPS biosynthesis